MIYEDMLFKIEDISMLITALIFASSFVLIVTNVINFVPDLIRSLTSKIKNESLIYSEKTLHDPKLDKTELGIKTIIDRVID